MAPKGSMYGTSKCLCKHLGTLSALEENLEYEKP